jgi:hypothetical protein
MAVSIRDFCTPHAAAEVRDLDGAYFRAVRLESIGADQNIITAAYNTAENLYQKDLIKAVEAKLSQENPFTLSNEQREQIRPAFKKAAEEHQTKVETTYKAVTELNDDSVNQILQNLQDSFKNLMDSETCSPLHDIDHMRVSNEENRGSLPGSLEQAISDLKDALTPLSFNESAAPCVNENAAELVAERCSQLAAKEYFKAQALDETQTAVTSASKSSPQTRID